MDPSTCPKIPMDSLQKEKTIRTEEKFSIWDVLRSDLQRSP